MPAVAGRARADSDVDVAILFDGPLDPVTLFDTGCRLAAELGVPVDLVDLRRAGGLLRVEATQRGRALVPPTVEAPRASNYAVLLHVRVAPPAWPLIAARLRMAAKLAALFGGG